MKTNGKTITVMCWVHDSSGAGGKWSLWFHFGPLHSQSYKAFINCAMGMQNFRKQDKLPACPTPCGRLFCCAGPHQTLPDDDGPGPCQMLAVIDPTRHWRGWTLPDAGCDRPYQTLEGLDPARRWLWSPEVNRSASCDAGSRVTGQLAHFKPNTFWILHTTYSCTADCRWSITDGGEGGLGTSE